MERLVIVISREIIRPGASRAKLTYHGESQKNKAKSCPIDASRVVLELSKSCPRVVLELSRGVQRRPEVSRVVQSCQEPLRVTQSYSELREKKRGTDRPTDRPTDGRTHPLIEMRGRI